MCSSDLFVALEYRVETDIPEQRHEEIGTVALAAGLDFDSRPPPPSDVEVAVGEIPGLHSFRREREVGQEAFLSRIALRPEFVEAGVCVGTDDVRVVVVLHLGSRTDFAFLFRSETDGRGRRTTEGRLDGRRVGGPTVVGRFTPGSPPRQKTDEDEASREDADRISGSVEEQSQSTRKN